ncbi:MAG: F0F1 ATP synthase subunit epsilon [Betaproteobacteria bacterium]|nr:F0F1 ATP synthase subunit epsilon [Gammaproteobacteria bacterium]MDH3435967.1 F0F1 ATP synthase subunit epsilon [Betaproteobacteria bacterium]
MNAFVMHLQSATQYERLENVVSFVGEDDSGHFGLLPSHERTMTVLRFGLARFCLAGSDWEYLALPGAVVYFVDNVLSLSTRRYVYDKEYARVVDILRREFAAEEEVLQDIKESVRQLEEEVLRRLWQMRRRGEREV